MQIDDTKRLEFPVFRGSECCEIKDMDPSSAETNEGLPAVSEHGEMPHIWRDETCHLCLFSFCKASYCHHGGCTIMIWS